MPVTKTAKRALRGSKRKMRVNKLMTTRLEIAIRLAKKGKKEKEVLTAISLADRASKNHIIHKNKAARIKSSLSKFMQKTAAKANTKASTKATKKGKK
jgi:small subunit ribosomal protein S20